MKKPGDCVYRFHFGGMRALECEPCVTDALWSAVCDTPASGKMLDIAARRGLDGYVIEYKVTVSAIAKIDGEAKTVEIYDAEKAGVESPPDAAPIPLAEFARRRGFDLKIEEDDRHDDCPCGMCGGH